MTCNVATTGKERLRVRRRGFVHLTGLDITPRSYWPLLGSLSMGRVSRLDGCTRIGIVPGFTPLPRMCLVIPAVPRIDDPTGVLDGDATKLCQTHEVRHRYRAVQLCHRRYAMGRIFAETTGDLLDFNPRGADLVELMVHLVFWNANAETRCTLGRFRCVRET